MTDETPETTIDTTSTAAYAAAKERRNIHGDTQIGAWNDDVRVALRSVADTVCDALDNVAAADMYLRDAAGCEDFDDEAFADKAEHWAIAASDALDNAGRELLAAIELIPDDHGYLPRREEPQRLQMPDTGRVTCPDCGRHHDVDKSTEAVFCECGFQIRFSAGESQKLEGRQCPDCGMTVPAHVRVHSCVVTSQRPALTVWDKLKTMSASVYRDPDGTWMAYGEWDQADTARRGDTPEGAIEALWSHWRDAGSPQWRHDVRG